MALIQEYFLRGHFAGDFEKISANLPIKDKLVDVTSYDVFTHNATVSSKNYKNMQEAPKGENPIVDGGQASYNEGLRKSGSATKMKEPNKRIASFIHPVEDIFKKLADMNDSKAFLNGITNDTTEADLLAYFAKYGPIQELTIKSNQNKLMRKNKRFAFITFEDVDAGRKVISEGVHVINGKNVYAHEFKTQPGKIFVGGITNGTTDDEIIEAFKKFGKVMVIEAPYDMENKTSKGFCFVTFEDVLVAKEVLKLKKVKIADRLVDVRAALPKKSARIAKVQSAVSGPANVTQYHVNRANVTQYFDYENGTIRDFAFNM